MDKKKRILYLYLLYIYIYYIYIYDREWNTVYLLLLCPTTNTKNTTITDSIIHSSRFNIGDFHFILTWILILFSVSFFFNFFHFFIWNNHTWFFEYHSHRIASHRTLSLSSSSSCITIYDDDVILLICVRCLHSLFLSGYRPPCKWQENFPPWPIKSKRPVR